MKTKAKSDISLATGEEYTAWGVSQMVRDAFVRGLAVVGAGRVSEALDFSWR
jgi:hypothetical protein